MKKIERIWNSLPSNLQESLIKGVANSEEREELKSKTLINTYDIGGWSYTYVGGLVREFGKKAVG